MTIGPWKPIKLHTYDVCLADVDIRNVVSETLDVKMSVGLSLSDKLPGSALMTLKNPQGDIVRKEKIEIESGNAHTEFEFSSGELQLWYPVHYGQQPLYNIVIAVCDTVRNDDSDCLYH